MDALTQTTGCPAWCSAGHGQLVGEDDAVHVGEVLLDGRWRVRLCLEDGGVVWLLLDECELGVADLPAFQAALHRLGAQVGGSLEVSPAPAAVGAPPHDC